MQERIEQLMAESSRLQGLRDGAKSRVKATEAQIIQITESVDLYTKVVAVLHTLLDLMLKSKAEDLASLLTEGMRAIFTDKKLSVQPQISVKRNRVNVDLETIEEKAYGEVQGDVMEAFGGGIAVSQGLILRLFTTLRLGLVPLVVADEPLGALSEKYRTAMGEFLRKFCAKTGLNLLMVTHITEFLEHAHTAYNASINGEGETTYKQVRCEEPDPSDEEAA